MDYEAKKNTGSDDVPVTNLDAISTDAVDRVNGADYYYPPKTWKQKLGGVWRQMLAVKPLELLLLEAGEQNQMARTLTAMDLLLLGIGCIIGTGIFVITGTAAAKNAGPAIVISFVIAGTVSGFAALCYAELAAMVPVSGSGFTYTYASLGEFAAWLNGWSLILEYAVGAATVAVGWSAYFKSLIYTISGYTLDPKWTESPIAWDTKEQEFYTTGNYICLPAMGITFLIAIVLILGTKQSAWVNLVIVVIKLVVITVFIIAGATKVDPDNWSPFIPANEGSFGAFGVTGMLQASTIVFFAYIGFDSVAATGQEAKNPQRDMPIGILGSLAIATAFYIAVCLVLTGMVPYTELNVANPIAHACELIGGMDWLATMVSVGAVAGLTSVMMVQMMAQPRVFYAMAQDGFFPKALTKIHPKFKTPYVTTIITAVFVAISSGILPIDVLGELTSLGTLFAFLLVAIGVTAMRKRAPDHERMFKVPFGPYVIPALSVLSSGLLICTANKNALLRMGIWLGVGVVLYFAYVRRHSKLAKRNRAAKTEA